MGENPLETLTCSSALELAQALFAQKEARRRALAALPVEEKYRQLLQLQHIVAETCRAVGRECPEPWPWSSAPGNETTG